MRASITDHAAGEAEGWVYPETVLLRLITPDGRPSV